ncbi:MAG: alginate lyase family protein [Candidatus Eremiobacteraeota bacterium]|nr:alginate lyase family protein [Candidatus Eremiobacteraeota bacterium]
MRTPPLPETDFRPDRILFTRDIFSCNDFTTRASPGPGGKGRFSSPEGPLVITFDIDGGILEGIDCLKLAVTNRGAREIRAGMRIEEAGGAVHLSGDSEPVAGESTAELLFPRESFGILGTPGGWQGASRLRLIFAGEKHSLEKSPLEVIIASLSGMAREQRQGPRLTSAGLRKSLALKRGNLSFPALPPPFCPGDAGLGVPPPLPCPLEEHRRLLKGTFMGLKLPGPWEWKKLRGGEYEVLHFLHRHHFVKSLLEVFAKTENDSIIVVLDRLLRRWINAYPVPLDSNGGASPQWETLSAAWRLKEWLWAAGIAWSHRSFRESTKKLMLRSFWEHCRHLADHRGHPGNWRIVEASALALGGLALPLFREAESWAATGTDWLLEEMERQFLDDGAHYELSPLYQAICLDSALEVLISTGARGKTLPRRFSETLEKGYDYLASMARPDFTWPSLNDSWGYEYDFCPSLERAGKILGRRDFLFIGSRGHAGEPPQVKNRLFPTAGLASLRSGHDGGSLHLIFRSGPPGVSHSHNDVLSLDLSAHGERILIDPGISRYTPGPMTDYYRSALSHTSLSIDGLERQASRMCFNERKGRSDARLCQAPLYAAASGTALLPSSGAGEVLVRRTVIFVREAYWIIADQYSGTGLHEIVTGWKWRPGPLVIDREKLSVKAPGIAGHTFTLIALPGAIKLSMDCEEGVASPPRGWAALRGTDRPAPSLRFRALASLPVSLLWLLLPFEPSGEACREDMADGSLKISFAAETGSREEFITYPPFSP